MRLRHRCHCAAAACLLLALTACTAFRPPYPTTTSPAGRTIAAGPYQPNWPSLHTQCQIPDWFRDAKFGIWAHWSAQCVPEQGDWYARSMYMQGSKQNLFHVATYGPPSQFGFMELDNLWRAEKWDPEKLMQLYVDAGAKYFVALANHEDNFDTFDSKYQPWNATRVGPHRDIVGTWARIARAHGLRFGVSNHSSHAWHWFQPAYGYDAEGPQAGVRYDAYRLTRADGKGKWWEGLDPQDLYVGPSIVAPDGIKTAKEMRDWNDKHNLPWTEDPPTSNPAFVNKWFLRAQDLVDKYHPDFFYMDNSGLPLGQAGLDFAAHYYNANRAYHGGQLEAVLADKGLRDERRNGILPDFERTVPPGLQERPFSADTCIGQWHYKRDIDYKTPGHVVRILADVVSKNGNLLLNIPQRGDGSIDDKELAVLKGITAWMKINGEGIFATRPWKIFGEGPTEVPRGRPADEPLPYTPQDFRFTTKGNSLYVFEMARPSGPIAIQTLGLFAETYVPIASIRLLGSEETLRWTQDVDALKIDLPAHLPAGEVIAFELKLKS